MRCRSVLTLGAHPQPAPGLAARRVALEVLEPRLTEALGSKSALRRQMAASEISAELSARSAGTAG
jgi:hypothetical protein